MFGCAAATHLRYKKSKYFGLRDAKGSNIALRFAEIITSIDDEDRIKEGVTWKEMLQPVNRYRVFLIIALQIG